MVGGINGPPVLNGPAYVYETKTLSALRDELLCMLGFPDPLTAADSATQTLVYLREQIMRRCGFYYVAGANTPGQKELIDSLINQAQQTIFATVEFDKGSTSMPALMVNDADLTTIHYLPIFLLGLGLAKAHYKQDDSAAYFEQFSKYLSDRAVRRPPKIVAMCTQWLKLAQKRLNERYTRLKNDLWWTIDIEAGERIYDVPYDASSGLDFGKAHEVWLLDVDRWLPMTGGIPPEMFTNTTQTIPTNFEFREYFEVFPEPDKAYTAYIKGHRGLLAFSADGDVTTLDPEVILIQALVWAKRHFRDLQGAREYERDLEDWIGRLNAKQFAGMRFVPRGTESGCDPLPYPTVTFPRT